MDSHRRHSRFSLALAIVIAVVALAATAGATNHFIINKSSEVKDGALQAKDLSKKARAKLRGRRGRRGRTGPVGPTGPTGAAGANGTDGTNGATGATGERGPSNAFTVHPTSINTNVCPAGPGCSSSTVLATLSLPAGSFVVNSAVTLTPRSLVNNQSYSVECHLNRDDTGAFTRTLNVYSTPTGAITTDETIHVDTALTLPAATTLSLTCGFGSLAFDANSPRITAIQVGTLQDTAT